MKTYLNKVSSQNLLVYFLLIIFFLDILNKLEISAVFPWFLFIKFGKFVFYSYFLWNICFNYKNSNTKYYLLILFSFFLISEIHLFIELGRSFNHLNELMPNLRFFILLMFPIIFSDYLANIPKSYYKKLEKVYIGIILIVILSVFVGLIGEFKFLKTYYDRFGYLGLMPKSITASYFFISSLTFSYYAYFINQRAELKWLLIVVALTSLLIGTKAIYTFIFLLFIFHFIYFKWYKKIISYGLIIVVLGSIVIFKNNLYTFLKMNFKSLMDLHETKGLITSLVSVRDQIFIENMSIYQSKWSWWNYLIGGRISETKLFESSILDLFSFFGLIGTLLYIKIIYENVNSFIDNKSNFIFYAIFSVFFISILAGQFFLNISGISYFIITLFLLNSYKYNLNQNN